MKVISKGHNMKAWKSPRVWSCSWRLGKYTKSSKVKVIYYMGWFLKWWYPTTMGIPTQNDHFGVFWGYHHLRKHAYVGHALLLDAGFPPTCLPASGMPLNLTFFICHEGTILGGDHNRDIWRKMERIDPVSELCWREKHHQKERIKKQTGCHISTLKQESTEMVFFHVFFQMPGCLTTNRDILLPFLTFSWLNIVKKLMHSSVQKPYDYIP